MTRSFQGKSTKRRKEITDGKKQASEYRVGDKVMAKLLPQQLKVFRKKHKSLYSDEGVTGLGGGECHARKGTLDNSRAQKLRIELGG